jgi:hypothetical protein
MHAFFNHEVTGFRSTLDAITYTWLIDLGVMRTNNAQTEIVSVCMLNLQNRLQFDLIMGVYTRTLVGEIKSGPQTRL